MKEETTKFYRKAAIVISRIDRCTVLDSKIRAVRDPRELANLKTPKIANYLVSNLAIVEKHSEKVSRFVLARLPANARTKQASQTRDTFSRAREVSQTIQLFRQCTFSLPLSLSLEQVFDRDENTGPRPVDRPRCNAWSVRIRF